MRRRIVGLTALGLAVSLGWLGVASAQDIRSGTDISVPASQTINGSLYVTGSTINVDGIVNGDIYCAGQNVTISAHVTGDVICAAQTLNVGGKVDGSLRLTGQNVTLTGSAAHNASIAAQTLHLDKDSNIGGDLSGFAQSASIGGQVGRDFTFGAQTADISGRIGRDVAIRVNKLSLTPEASITGMLTYTSHDQATINGAVKGKITRNEPPAPAHRNNLSHSNMMGAWRIGLMLFLTITALTLVLLWPQTFESLGHDGLKHWGKSFGIGLLSAMLILPVFIILCLTVLGLPFAFFTLLVWILIELLSVPLGTYALGRLIWRRQHNQIVVMITGLVALGILWIIPIVGLIAWTLVEIFGIGIIVRKLLSSYHSPKYGRGV